MNSHEGVARFVLRAYEQGFLLNIPTRKLHYPSVMQSESAKARCLFYSASERSATSATNASQIFEHHTKVKYLRIHFDLSGADRRKGIQPPL